MNNNQGLNDDSCPCMNPDAFPKRIRVGTSEVGIIGLKEIIQAVNQLGLSDESVIKKKLLERILKRNYVPDSAKNSYMDALFKEYLRSIGNK